MEKKRYVKPCINIIVTEPEELLAASGAVRNDGHSIDLNGGLQEYGDAGTAASKGHRSIWD